MVELHGSHYKSGAGATRPRAGVLKHLREPVPLVRVVPPHRRRVAAAGGFPLPACEGLHAAARKRLMRWRAEE